MLALELQHLSHTFGTHRVLDDVSFSLERGQFAVLLGPNGAGKTTLFALATRLYHSRGGAIRIFGIDLRNHPRAALGRIGVVFQQPTLDLDLSVAQNLYYHAALHGLSRHQATARMAAELEAVEMTEIRNEKVRHLSGGQRRRVEIARAMLHKPSLLLLDEATSGLDIASRQYLLERVRRLCRDQALAVLWATHLIDEAEHDSTIILLHRGKVRAHGSVAEVCAASGAASLKVAYQKMTAADAR